MKLFFLLLLLSPSAFACWYLKGEVTIADQHLKIDQKMNHDQVYSFMTGAYVLHLKIPSQGALHVTYEVKEKIKLAFKDIAHGKFLIREGKPTEIVEPSLTFQGQLTSI